MVDTQGLAHLGTWEWDVSEPTTGMGLADTQRIIERPSGRIGAEGSINQGAVFFLELPAPHHVSSAPPAADNVPLAS